jgi:hypothetical protein
MPHECGSLTTSLMAASVDWVTTSVVPQRIIINNRHRAQYSLGSPETEPMERMSISLSTEKACTVYQQALGLLAEDRRTKMAMDDWESFGGK